MQRQMMIDRENAERQRIEMMKKEKEIRESKDFMKFVNKAVENVNNAVFRG